MHHAETTPAESVPLTDTLTLTVRVAGFYASTAEGRCKPEVPVGLPCSPKDVCAKNAECSATVGGGVCQCRQDFYKVRVCVCVCVCVL